MQLRELLAENKSVPNVPRVSLNILHEEFEGVDVDMTLNALVDLVTNNYQATKLHSLVVQLNTVVSRELSKANINVDNLVDLISEPVIDDVFGYYDKVMSLQIDIANNMRQIEDFEKKLQKLNLNKIPDNSKKNAELVEWLQQNTACALEQTANYLQNTRQVAFAQKGNNFGEQYSELLGNLRDDCDTSSDRIKELYQELCAKCNHTYSRCVVCSNLFDKNIDKIRDKQIELLLDKTVAGKILCQTYHQKATTLVDDQLLLCKDNDKLFFENVSTFLSEYKTAYEQHRKHTLKALDMCESMKKSIKCSSNKGKSKTKEPLDDSAREQIRHINSAKSCIENSANTARIDYKLDSDKINTRVTCLENVLQKY